MADLLPSRPDVADTAQGDPRVVGVDSDEADELLGALSSRTARRVLTALHEEPSPPAELAARVDTTLQNVQYHLENLLEAGLVEVAETAYSEKGREMKVYAPSSQAVVVVAGREEDAAGLAETLTRLLGGVGILGLASLAVERLLNPTAGPLLPSFGGAAGGGNAPPAGGGGSSDAGGGAGAGGYSADTEAGAGLNSTAHTTAAEGAGTDATAGTATSTPTGATADGTTHQTGTPPTADSMTQTTETAAGGAGDVTHTAVHRTTEFVEQGVESGAADALVASPGLLFFLGGVTALLLLTVLVWRR